jgi:hypothetical protein
MTTKLPKNFISLAEAYPDIASEWDHDKNESTPDLVSKGSGKKVWWKCVKEHTWNARIGPRTRQRVGCPICANKKVLKGYNDLATINPILAKEWHPSKNSKGSDEVRPATNLKFWWICSEGHEWEALLSNRFYQKQGCPYCSRQKVVAGEGDFATTHPQFLKEWNFARNLVLPSDFGWGSEKKVWWICSLGHEWENPIRNRVIGRNCPYCSNRAILPGFNDLETLNPKLALEWHPNKNVKPPSQHGAGSAFKAWWICVKGHEWKSTIVNRHLLGRGCEKCCKMGTSKSEIAFRKEFSSYLSKINQDHTTRIKLKGKEKHLQVDIIGEYKGKKIVIEYDGSLYHAIEKRVVADIENTKFLLSNGYIVVRIREGQLPFLDLIDKHLFQISHRFSLEPKDIIKTKQEILEWLNSLEPDLTL